MQRNGCFAQSARLAPAFPSHVQWSQENAILSPPECDALIAMGEGNFAPASIGTPTQMRIDKDYRCADVCLLPLTKKTQWLYERITERCVWANDEYFRFELQGLIEEVQLLRYQAAANDAPAGHYNQHQDFGEGYMARRKLSVVINLSDPADYDGGRLTLITHQNETMPYVQRGEGFVFPSWSPHQVSEVSRGTRFALVAWVSGNPFR